MFSLETSEGHDHYLQISHGLSNEEEVCDLFYVTPRAEVGSLGMMVNVKWISALRVSQHCWFTTEWSGTVLKEMLGAIHQRSCRRILLWEKC